MVDAVLLKNPFDVPESMVRRQIEYKVEDMKSRLSGFGMPPEEIEKNLSQMKESIARDAEVEVKGGILLEAIARQQGIKLDDKDFDNYFRETAEKSGKPQEEIRKIYEDEMTHLAGSLMDKKVLDFLMSKAKIK